MEVAINIFLVAVLIEAISENIKWLLDGEFTRDKVVALLVSELLVFSTGTSIFAVANINMISSTIAMLCTGVLLCRGANYLHDLMGKLEKK